MYLRPPPVLPPPPKGKVWQRVGGTTSAPTLLAVSAPKGRPAVLPSVSLKQNRQLGDATDTAAAQALHQAALAVAAARAKGDVSAEVAARQQFERLKALYQSNITLEQAQATSKGVFEEVADALKSAGWFLAIAGALGLGAYVLAKRRKAAA